MHQIVNIAAGMAVSLPKWVKANTTPNPAFCIRQVPDLVFLLLWQLLWQNLTFRYTSLQPKYELHLPDNYFHIV